MSIESIDFDEVLSGHAAAYRAAEPRTTTQKSKDFATSLMKEIKYSVVVAPLRSLSSEGYDKCGTNMTWKQDSTGLFVFIHGLGSHPSAWDDQLKLLEQTDAKIDRFAPFIYRKGECPLDEAVAPLMPTILDYTEKNPGRPVCLLGISNGTRIAAAIAQELSEKSPGTPVKVSAIAGVFFGSPAMTVLNKTGISKMVFPAAVRKELAYGSEKSKELLSQMVEHPGACSYDFFASTEDFVVPSLGSSLPYLDQNERCYVIHGYGHNSMIWAVAKPQILACIAWMNQVAKE